MFIKQSFDFLRGCHNKVSFDNSRLNWMLGSVLVQNISNISLDNLVIIKSDFHLRWFTVTENTQPFIIFIWKPRCQVTCHKTVTFNQLRFVLEIRSFTKPFHSKPIKQPTVWHGNVNYLNFVPIVLIAIYPREK